MPAIKRNTLAEKPNYDPIKSIFWVIFAVITELTTLDIDFLN